MTTTQLLLRAQSDADSAPSPQAARISFRQPVAGTGFIDAAWWPRTLDLTAELPLLLDVVFSAGRDINRITYNSTAWQPAPRQMQIEGHKVRLGGFATGDPLTVRLSDAWGRERIDILVIAPDTDPSVADRAMQIASSADDPYRAEEILERANAAGDAGPVDDS